MGLPATLAIANYLGKNDNETWITLRKTDHVDFGAGGTLNREIGTRTVVDFNGKDPSFKVTPAFRAQYTQNITDNEHLNVKLGARLGAYDEIQAREFATLDYKINDKLHASVSGHFTSTTNGLLDMEKPLTIGNKAGGYATVSYQATPKLNIWWDPYQGNYDINKKSWSHSTNFGITYKF